MIRLRPVLAGFALLAAAASPVAAQAPAQGPAQSNEPLPSTKFPQPSASHFAVAREAAVLTGLTRSFDAILPQFAEQARASIRNTPQVAGDLEQVLKQLEPELELQKQRIINTAARLIAGRLSEADLKEVLTFFKSPLGKRWMDAQPEIFEDMLKEAEAWTAEVSEYMNIRIRAEMAKRGKSLDGR